MISLTEDNYIMYAMKCYHNPQCSGHDEFIEDISRIKYIKRLLKKYTQIGVFRERLILNHIIIMSNVFGAEECSRILFFRIEEKYHSPLKTILVYLNYLPQEIPEVLLDEIPLDSKIINILRSI